jgi:tight adherence protein B
MKRVRPAAVLLVALVAAIGAARPAFADGNVRIRQVDVHAYPNVALTVTLAGGGQLSTSDVRLTENGRAVPPLSVRPVGPTSGRVDVVLVIDTSDSMRGQPLDNAYRAARTFVTGLPDWMRVGLVTFAEAPTVQSALTTDHASVLRLLATVPPTTAKTGLYDAVESAAGMFSDPGQHTIILLTDGRNTVDGTTQDAVRAAKKAHASVYTIGLEGASSDVPTLQAIAAGTGGAFSSASASDLRAIYGSLAKELAEQYVVQYRSRTQPGSQVDITLTVPQGTDSAVAVLPLPRVQAPAPSRWPGIPAGTVGLLIVLALFFLSFFALLWIALDATGRQRRDRELGRRVGAVVGGAPERPDAPPRAHRWMPTALSSAGDRVADTIGLRGRLEARLERAAVPMRPGEFVMIVVGSALLGCLVGAVMGRWWLVALLGALGAYAPVLWLRVKVARRLGRLHEQLPDLLMILASSLRAGHSFMQALDMVTQEVGEPAAGEFARVLTEIRLGRPVPDALNAMAERVGSEDFKWAVLAVNIQREVGGNLAEILENVAVTVRERAQIRRQVKVLSGEGRLSVAVLIGLPFALALGLELLNPGYINVLFTDPIGWVMLGAAGLLMIVGIFWMRKLVRIDV